MPAASSSAPPWDGVHDAGGQLESHDLYGLTVDQPRMTPVDLAAYDDPVWTTPHVKQENCPHDTHQALRNLLPDVRELKAAGVKTLYVITDTRPLEQIEHIRPFAAFLHNRLAYRGPSNEITSAVFYQLGPSNGFEQVHYTSAGPLLISQLRTLMPTVGGRRAAALHVKPR